MGLKAFTYKVLNSVFKSSGYEIVASKQLYEWQKQPWYNQAQSRYKESRLPQEAVNYLQQSNSRLQDLQARYAIFNNKATDPLCWTNTYVKPEDILYFRGDNSYVWQLRSLNMNPLSYALTTFYVKSIDKLGLLELLEEDDLFGIFTFRIDNRLISRDLLDSIMEIYFLEKHLSLSVLKDMTILDIGAGYGRLAHRMVTALANIQNYLCTDAVAVSSFISEYYLRFRNVEGKANVVPLDEIENTLRNRSVNIAINIHSFLECKISAIDWWLSILGKYRVKYLMIVPNGEHLQTNDGKDFGEVIKTHGYKLVAKDPSIEIHLYKNMQYVLSIIIYSNFNKANTTQAI